MADTFNSSSDGPLNGNAPWSYSDDADALAQPEVLVVEDDRDIRDMLSTLLDMAGYAVRTCATAEEALEALREQMFDLVLTDYALPHRTGLWLIENATAEGLTADTPVLIVTAHPQVATAAEYEIITKPFDVDDLIERVRRRTENARPRRRQLAGQARPGGDPAPEGPPCPEPVELVLYVNAKSPRSEAAVRSLRKAVERLNSPRAKITICEMDGDPCKHASHDQNALERSTKGPRTFILGHITNPEPLLELLTDCDTWE